MTQFKSLLKTIISHSVVKSPYLSSMNFPPRTLYLLSLFAGFSLRFERRLIEGIHFRCHGDGASIWHAMWSIGRQSSQNGLMAVCVCVCGEGGGWGWGGGWLVHLLLNMQYKFQGKIFRSSSELLWGTRVHYPHICTIVNYSLSKFKKSVQIQKVCKHPGPGLKPNHWYEREKVFTVYLHLNVVCCFMTSQEHRCVLFAHFRCWSFR